MTVCDEATGDTIYRTSFSSLYNEWLSTDEATTTPKGFEHTVLVPYPKAPALIDIDLYNSRHESMARMRHRMDPADILISKKGEKDVTPHKYIHKGGDPNKAIDVAILAEGYTTAEMDSFYRDAEIAVKSILDYEPFKSHAGDFNFVAVAMAGIPYEHIIILANTPEYGGGGIYNSYTLTAAGHKMFKPVVVHEFGHSFGGLGDEYFYEGDVMDDSYPKDVEPWEPNITTLVDFDSKWKNLLPKDCPIPTPVSEAAKYPVGVYEGGGYSFHGVFRPADDCRMRTNTAPAFCPACQKAMDNLINFYVNE